MDVSVDKKDLERLIEKLDQSPGIIKQAKKKAFEHAAPKLEALIDRGMAPVGLHEVNGKVKGWQESYVGSKGGYAAVRPKAKTFTEPTKKLGKRYAVGAVTNAIDAGHKYPSPSGKAKRKRKARIQHARMNVKGYPFYSAAQELAPEVAEEAAQEIVQALMKHLEG